MVLIGLRDCERAVLYSSQMFNNTKRETDRLQKYRSVSAHNAVQYVCLFICHTWCAGVTWQEDSVSRCSRKEAALTSLGSFTSGL